MSVTDWSTQPSNNASIDAGIQAQDGAPSTTVSSSLRNLMARVASLALDSGGALTSSGTGNTYTVTTNGGIGTLKPGVALTIQANRANTAAPFLNVDGKGALPWVDTAGDAWSAGAIEPGVLYMVAWVPGQSGQPASWRTVAATGSVLTEKQLSGTFVRPVGATTSLPIDEYLRTIMPAAAFGIVADAELNTDGTLKSGTDQTAKLNSYFKYCHDNGIRPRLPRAAGNLGYLALGTVYLYDSGDYDGVIYAQNYGYALRESVPADSVGVDGKTITISGLPPGSRAVLYSQKPGGKLRLLFGTTVSNSGVATWTLTTAPESTEVLTYLTRSLLPASAVISSDRKVVTLGNLYPGWTGALYAEDQAFDESSIVNAVGTIAWGSTSPSAPALPTGAVLSYDARPGPVISIAPASGDISTIPTAQVQGWRNCIRGASRIGNMSSDLRGKYITVDTSEQTLIGRKGADNIQLGEGFYVNDIDVDAGHITPKLYATWKTDANGNVAWSTGVFRAQTVRARIAVTPPQIVLYGPARGQRTEIVVVSRCNVDLFAGDIRNPSGGTAEQGISLDRTYGVRLFTPTIDQLGVVATNYSVSIGLSANTEIHSGSGTGCRRSLDAHRSKDVSVFGGSYPCGMGAHYVWGFKAFGVSAGVTNQANPYVLHFAGGDFLFSGCVLTLSEPGNAVFRARHDIMQCGGQLALLGCQIDIDTTGLTGDPVLIDIFGSDTPNDGYDTVVETQTPDDIVVDAATIVRLRGPDTSRSLTVFRLLRQLGGQHTRSIVTSGRVRIEPRIVFDKDVTAPPDLKARCKVELYRPSKASGTGYDMRFGDLPGVDITATAENASATTGPRHDIEVVRSSGVNSMAMNSGIVRRAVFLECSGQFKTLTDTPYTAVGDEVRRIVPLDLPIENVQSIVKTTSGLAFKTASTTPLELLDAPGQTTFWTLRGGIPNSSAAALAVTGSGSETKMDLVVKGAGGFQLKGYDGAVTGLAVPIVASGVNYPTMRGAERGSAVVYGATGADTTISVLYSARGTLGSAILGLSGQRVGFYGTDGGQKQTVSGARGGNTALADLLTKLANLGLITDATTA